MLRKCLGTLEGDNLHTHYRASVANEVAVLLTVNLLWASRITKHRRMRMVLNNNIMPLSRVITHKAIPRTGINSGIGQLFKLRGETTSLNLQWPAMSMAASWKISDIQHSAVSEGNQARFSACVKDIEVIEGISISFLTSISFIHAVWPWRISPATLRAHLI